jgi:predicted ATPase
MLTRIEIDGFKSFERFSLDFGPFLVILGPNASGKSNLFDAVRFLSAMAGTDLRSAVKGLRGEPHELLRRDMQGQSVRKMSFAVEVLLNPEVGDPWGATVAISHSRVRYELEIQHWTDDRGIERLLVTRESARPIFAKADLWAKARKFSDGFRETFLRYGRRTPWLETAEEGGRRVFRVHQDGRAGRTTPAQAAEATVLSSFSSAEAPHLYALREELRSWRLLQLDPASLRRPSPITAADELEPDGSNLATVLARIQAETATKTRPRGILTDIAADLVSLIPGVVDLRVEKDERNREWRVDIGLRDEPPFSSRVVSDGTLRVLALLTLLHDPKHRGLVCFEEPENGVHPGRLRELVGRLRALTTRLSAKGHTKQTSQVLVNSHSPVVLSSLGDGEALFADMVTVVKGGAGKSRRTRMRPVRRDRQANLDRDGETVGTYDVERYLSTVQGMESSLP